MAVIVLLAVVVVNGFRFVENASAQGYSGLNPILVENSRAELKGLGCREVPLSNEEDLATAKSLSWRAVVASDTSGESLIFCPSSAAGSLIRVNSEGQVAGVINEAQAQAGQPTGWGQLVGGFWEGAWQGLEFTTAVRGAKATLELGLELISGLFFLIAMAGIKIISIGLNAINFSLQTNNEVSSTAVVQNLWPLFLGVANSGFLLALVLIALMHVLRLEFGGGIRRLLPKLLIAALLVNFSLVIAGGGLDIIKVVMAIISRAAAPNGNLDALSSEFTQLAGLNDLYGNIVTSFPKIEDWEAITEAAASLVAAIFIWVVAISAWLVAIGLIFRWVGLILLVVASPLIFLAIAFPGLGGWAKKWFSAYVRYALYAPIILIIMLGALNLNILRIHEFFDVNSTVCVNEEETYPECLTHGQRDMAKASALQTVIVASFLIAAAKAGKWGGIMGASVVGAMAISGGKRLKGLAYRGARGTTWPVRFAGKEAAGGAKKFGRDFYEAGKARGKAALGFAPGAKPAGKKLGERAFGKPLTKEKKRERDDASKLSPPAPSRKSVDNINSWTTAEKRAAATPINNADSPWRAGLVGQSHVGGELSREQRMHIMQNDEVKKPIRVALAGNADAVDEMTPGERDYIENLEVNLQTNFPTDTSSLTTNTNNRDTNHKNQIKNETNRALQQAYYRSLNELARKEASKK